MMKRLLKRMDDHYAVYNEAREKRANLIHQWFGIAVTVGAAAFLVYITLSGIKYGS